jgi:hypothetical protein
LIQFTCPSCKSPCSVGDQFARRKIKCPKCGARVVHVKDSQVELLTAGTPPPPPASAEASAGGPAPGAAPAAPAPPGPPVPSEATPVATAVVPHLVGEFVQQSESKQNTYILIGLVGVVAVAIGAVGLIVNIPLLAVTPVGAALIGVAVWHLQRKKRLEAELQAIAARKKKAGEQTEPMKKA